MVTKQAPGDTVQIELAPGAELPLSASVNGASQVEPEPVAEVEPLSQEPEEEQPLPWGDTPIDELLEHDALKSVLSEREAAATESARKEFHTKLQPLIAQRNQQLQALASQGGRFMREFEKASRDGNLDGELLDRYEDSLQKISGAYWHLGRFDGAKAFILEIGNALADESLMEDFRPRIELLESGGQDESLFKDLLARVTKRGVVKEEESADKKGYERGLAEGRKAALEEMKAQVRSREGPDLTPKRAGGPGLLNIDKYKNMSGEERRKLPPSEIDRMTAEIASSLAR